MAEAFDANRELVEFYKRHFDELVDNSLAVFTAKNPTAALNTLPMEERRDWIALGLTDVIKIMLGEKAAEDIRTYCASSGGSAGLPFFGAGNVINSCECALFPDEAIIPILFEDYGHDLGKLCALVIVFRQAVNNYTKHRTAELIGDFKEYVKLAERGAVQAEQARIEREVYQKLYMAMHGLVEKTATVSDMVARDEAHAGLRAQLTQLKLMEADIVEEVFRECPALDPKAGVGASEEAGQDESKPAGVARSFPAAADAAGLTAREREVCELVATGLSNKEIAERLGIAESTVKNRISDLLAKLGKTTRAQIVVFAATNGFFD